MLCLYSCSEKTEVKSLNIPSEDWRDFILDINLPLTDGFHELDWEWKFFIGEDSGWSLDGLPKFTDFKWVEFPHRYYQPNTPFWYQTKVKVDFNEPKWMYINADDGVQVYKNQDRIIATNGFYYFLDKLTKGDVLTLRVINDAGSGGIRKLGLAKTETAEEHFAKQDSLFQAIQTTYKALQHLNADDVVGAKNSREVLEIFESKIDGDKNSLPWIRKYPWLSYHQEGEISFSTVVANTESVNILFSKANSSESELIVKMEQRENEVFSIRLESKKISKYDHYYLLLSDEFKSGPFSLNVQQIAKDKNDAINLAFWSDCQGGWMRFDSIVKQMIKEPPQLHIGVGDFVSNGYFETQWHQFFHFGNPLMSSIPGIYIPGNHDYDGYYDFGVAEVLNQYLLHDKNETVRGYHIDGLYFLGVDLNTQFPIGFSENPDNVKKLENIFQSSEWENAEWRILLVHHPAFGESAIGYGGEAAVRDLLRKANAFHSIDLVVSGHNHRYERGIFDDEELGHFMQLTVGGAGRVSERPYTAPLNVMDTVVFKHHFAQLSFHANQITGKIIGTDGSLIDEFSFSKKSD